MARIIHPAGYIYVNAPTTGPYHCYPGDNWRFYSDAGQALAYWSGKQNATEEIFPVKVVETFNVLGECWNDFICVWKRVDIDHIEKNITVSDEIIKNKGPFESAVHKYGFNTRKKW